MPETADFASYQMNLVPMQAEHLPALHRLSVAIGWPHRPADWQVNLAAGEGIVAVDEAGRVHGSAMQFALGRELGAIAMVLAHPKLAGSGLTDWLARSSIERAGGGRVFLNACLDAVPMFRDLGAEGVMPVYLHQGWLAAAPAPDCPVDAQIRPAGLADIARMAALDSEAYEGDRRRLLTELAGISEAWVIERAGVVTGFAMRRPFGRGHVVGPIIAGDEADALALTDAALEGLAGAFVRVDTRAEAGPFRRYLQARGLRPSQPVITMRLGRARRAGAPYAFGLSSHSAG